MPHDSDQIARPSQRAARRHRLTAVVRATRGRIARQGLRQRRGHRPPPAVRRRILATATSTGLVAPLFALDGVPAELADPAGANWDALGPGSVVAASTTIAAAAEPTTVEALARPTPGLPSIAGTSTELLLRATPWVRAAGVAGLGVATPDEIRRAEEALALSLSSGVTEATVERIRRAQLQPTEDVVRALGLHDGSGSVTPGDVIAAATALEVPMPDGLTPATVGEVLKAGTPLVSSHLERKVAPYARALGLDIGRTVDAADTAAVAAELGIDLPDVPSGSDAQRLHRAWLQTLAPHFDRFGLDEGNRVDPVDTIALARALGASVDSGVGPAKLTQLLRAFDAQQGSLVPYGRMGEAVLHLPSQHVVRAGYHESSNTAALVPQDLGAERSFVLPSRGRGSHSHSAIDVAVQPGTLVHAPVSGTIVESVDYMLYGEYPDTRIRIRPDANPSIIVTVLHVTGSHVRSGDHVEAGDPLAAQATKFPFRSQIDDVVGSLPHVHIEAKAG